MGGDLGVGACLRDKLCHAGFLRRVAVEVHATKAGRRTGPKAASDFAGALTLFEAFYPAARIPPKISFGLEEIMERVMARRAVR